MNMLHYSVIEISSETSLHLQNKTLQLHIKNALLVY